MRNLFFPSSRIAPKSKDRPEKAKGALGSAPLNFPNL
jgi:hypothetical protein